MTTAVRQRSKRGMRTFLQTDKKQHLALDTFLTTLYTIIDNLPAAGDIGEAGAASGHPAFVPPDSGESRTQEYKPTSSNWDITKIQEDELMSFWERILDHIPDRLLGAGLGFPPPCFAGGLSPCFGSVRLEIWLLRSAPRASRSWTAADLGTSAPARAACPGGGLIWPGRGSQHFTPSCSI